MLVPWLYRCGDVLSDFDPDPDGCGDGTVLSDDERLPAFLSFAGYDFAEHALWWRNPEHSDFRYQIEKGF
jgi:hypothetical protein